MDEEPRCLATDFGTYYYIDDGWYTVVMDDSYDNMFSLSPPVRVDVVKHAIKAWNMGFQAGLRAGESRTKHQIKQALGLS